MATTHSRKSPGKDAVARAKARKSARKGTGQTPGRSPASLKPARAPDNAALEPAVPALQPLPDSLVELIPAEPVG